jgi:hypothetical protein
MIIITHKTMSTIIINIITLEALLKGRESEKRTLRSKIDEYLKRIEIVSDSNVLALLHQTIELLSHQNQKRTLEMKEIRDSKLKNILQDMQTAIEKLQKSKSREKSYAIAARVSDESQSKSKKAGEANNSRTTRLAREFTMIIDDEKERKKLKSMSIKNIMIKMQSETKEIRDITRLANEALRIQAKSTKTKNLLQKRAKVIRRVIESTTIQSRTYSVRVNEIRMKHINVINQTSAIAYLHEANARLHSELIIKKMT